MKQGLTLLFAIALLALNAQIPSYYNDVDLTLTGQDLQAELSIKVTNSQTTILSYTPGVWDALKQSDLDPSNASRVILIYGYNDNDGIVNTDRTRGVDDNGGGSTDWNREHVYPRSLGNPNLGSTGPGSDAHHLRPADVSRNSDRGNRKFADGSGNSGVTSQGHWYPGDEFKGDVARMMMFMYIRYGNRCLPTNVGVGSSAASDANMLNLFLEWNAEDPVSPLEQQRNPIIENLQGNRNPFIDNPAFATQIWGGPQAEDLFGGGENGNDLCTSTITTLPYGESFESGFGGWNQANSSDDFNWTRKSGGTPSSGTGPSSADDGSYYIYMESSTPNYSNKRAILFGPCFDLNGASQANFDFRYHMLGASNMGSLSLEASLDGSTWTGIWTRSGNQGSLWQSASVDLSGYLGQVVQLRFNGITGTTWKGDMAIDDLELLTGSGNGGNGPVNTALTFIFDNYPQETSWNLKDDGQNTIYSGGTYGAQPDGSTLNIPIPLDPGCYTLSIFDSYGDGICCGYGNGSYTMTETASGNLLASGGSFGSSDVSNFCVGSNGIIDTNGGQLSERSENTEVLDIAISPNPVQDILTLDAPKEGSFSIFDTQGKIHIQGKVRSQIDVSSLPSGLYLMAVNSGIDKGSKMFVKL